jgi:hypothetical protein
MNNPYNRLPWGAKAIVLAVAAVAIVACEKRLDSAGKATDNKQVASGSAVLLGTTPAPPTTPPGAPPETTPVDPNKPLAETAQTTSSAEDSKELSKAEESRAMPLPGQPNDHSNLATDASQKAGQTDPQMQSPRSDVQPNAPQRQGQSATQ